MNTIHLLRVCARPGRAQPLGRCLARLDWPEGDSQGCVALRVVQEQPLSWRLEGQWRSVAARDAFLAGDCLRQVLAEALRHDWLARLEWGVPALPRVA